MPVAATAYLAARELIAIRSIRVRTTYSPLAARHVTNHHTRDELPQPSLEQSMDLSARRPDIQEAPMGYKSGSDDGSIDRPEAGGASSALPLTGQELKGAAPLSARAHVCLWCYAAPFPSRQPAKQAEAPKHLDALLQRNGGGEAACIPGAGHVPVGRKACQ